MATRHQWLNYGEKKPEPDFMLVIRSLFKTYAFAIIHTARYAACLFSVKIYAGLCFLFLCRIGTQSKGPTMRLWPL